MTSSEKFCLRWNDFESNISQAFRELREEKSFFDLTLVCEDSQIMAHKVILSACSQFFRKVLQLNPHQHPLLYLKGVKYQELLSVLNFMYHGETNVAQEDLNSFLAVAEDLQVKGLTTPAGAASNRSLPSKPVNREPPSRRPPAAPPQQQQEVEEVEEIPQPVVKPEPVEAAGSGAGYQAGTSSIALQEDQYQENYEYGDYGENYDESGGGLVDPNTEMTFPIGQDTNKALMDSQMRGLGGGRWECLQCGFTSKSTNVRYHIESKHMEGSAGYYCNKCQNHFRTRNALNTHMSSKHKYE